jgi:hypothetical protein
MRAEYCWAITQASGRSCCGWSGSSVLEFGFQLHSFVHTYTYTLPSDLHKIRLASKLPQRNYCVRRGVSVYTDRQTDRHTYKKLTSNVSKQNNWPVKNSDLVNTYIKDFIQFTNSIDF